MKTLNTVNLAIAVLLAILVGGCQKQNKTGEAFVVLKSGEVIYMADMEVVCLKPSFKNDFNGWRAEYESQDRPLVRGIETGNPTVKAKLKEIDDSIATLNATISGMSADEKKISDGLASAVESDRDKLVAEMAKQKDVLEEYKQIVEPIDKQIKELEVDADKVKQELTTLTAETVQKVNAYIVESKLTVPKLKLETADSLFEVEKHYWPDGHFDHPFGKAFVIERSRPDYGGVDWVFLVNIPAGLEATQIGTDIKAAYHKWLDIAKRLENAEASVRTKKEHKDRQVIPWQNRHGISQWEGQNLVELEKQQKASLARLNENLNVFKAGGTEARALVQQEIKKRVSALNETLDLLNQQRRELLQDAAEKARSELKAEYRQKFYELMKKDAVAAVRTGSKGDFIIPSEATYLYAATQRDNGEKLAWLVRIEPNSPKIKMSVSNAASAGSGDFDDFWMLRWSLAE